MKPQMIAHNLKVLLTRSNGWTLTFPSLGQPYDARADHRTNGKVDWHLETEWLEPAIQINFMAKPIALHAYLSFH
jgi:hypothetical protein